MSAGANTTGLAESLTMASLRALGFSDRQPEFTSIKLGYDMGGWDLTAQETVNRWMVPIVRVSGVIHTPRVLSQIDIEMLQTVEIPQQAAAFLVFGLRDHRDALSPLPSWWVIGEDNLDLHPLVQQQKQYEERMRAYRARPHCFINIEQARLFRRQLREAISALLGEDVAILTFNGQVLQASLVGRNIAVLASGDAWPHAVSWPLNSSTKLPGRFSSESVTLGYFEKTLDFENYRYSGATEVW